MTDKKLLNSLSNLGFQMLEPSEEFDVNETLAHVVKSNDMRLLESFPVLLARTSDKAKMATVIAELREYTEKIGFYDTTSSFN